MNQLKRLLSIALSAAMLASAFPAFADDSSDTGAVGSQQEGTPDESNTDITVSLRFQRYGEHVSLPIEYTFDTAQRTSFAEYGFGDEMTAVEQDGSVTPMHLLAEHYFQTVLGADDSLISSVADPETGLKTEGLFLIDYMSSKADSQTAFMFTVNNEIPSNEETGIQYSMPEYSLKDGDEVVIYEGWGGIWSETDPLDTYYTYFTDDTAETVAGDGITLELDGFGIYGMTEMPIEGAQLEAALLTEGEEPVFEDIPDAVTDSDGQAIISFDRAGTYLVSAYRVSDYFLTSGPYAEDISRPLCIVTVSDDTVESYLPAPGQFVNLPEYSDPEKALIEKTGDIITLGSFGGSIVYKFASPIRNDEKNPYGIDFVIYGNAFANADGQTSQSAGEPAAVQVSSDGVTWYELAGSEYYNANTRHGVTVTYQNPDTEFTGAQPITWTDNENGSGTIPIVAEHTQSYYPNPELYNAYQSGAGKNDTYTAGSVSFTGSMIPSEANPVFGYADVHAKSESETEIQNPYAEKHLQNSNGDGFDLSWAVDSEGNPVYLDRVSYVKVYNAKLAVSETTGESSPEIASIEKAIPNNSSVGTSDGLTSLTVNGNKVDLRNGTFTYAVNAGEADSLVISAESGSDNIYISGQRAESGEEVTLPACDKTRIIVQDGYKAPVIYTLDIIIVTDADTNTQPESVFALPGNTEAVQTAENTYEITFPSSVSRAKIGVKPMVYEADVVLDEETLTQESGWLMSETFIVSRTSELNFTITSRDGSVSTDYTILIKTSGDSGSGGELEGEIEITFELLGDTKHGSSDHRAYTTWIRAQDFNVPEDSTVEYVTQQILMEKEMPFTSDGGYFSMINNLSELDNGNRSGWRYSVNGDDPEVGCADYVLDDGDEVTWYFTDDYTKSYGDRDDDDDDNNNSSNRPSSGRPSSGNNTTVTVPPTGNTENGGNESGGEDIKFTDVEDGFWASEYINSCARNGLIFGKTETTFEPNAPVTRAEFIAMLNRIDGETAEYEGNFEDVSEDDWFCANVAWAVKSGITYGVSETSFAPSAQITRQEMAVMLTRYLAYKQLSPEIVNDEKVFEDENEIADYAKASVSDMQKMGIISGRDDGRFAPLDTATRAEASVLLSKIYDLVPKGNG